MGCLKRVISYIIFFVNAISAIILLLTAYSSFFEPEKYPILSCSHLAFPLLLLLNIGFCLFWLLFCKRYFFLSLIALLICIPSIRIYCPVNLSSTDIPANRIKIMSYNVMSFGGLKMEKGNNPILQYLAKSNADIICLQEYAVADSDDVYHVNIRYVNEMMKGYPYRDITEIGSSKSNKVAVFSRFPILSSRRILYKSNYNGSVYYELEIYGDTIALINNHLESNKLTEHDKSTYEKFVDSPKTGDMHVGFRSIIYKLADASLIRAAQANELAKAINNISHKEIIMCGDFNDGPLSYTHKILAEHLNDTFSQSGNGLGVSYNRHKFYFRIDNILISKNYTSYNCRIDNSIKYSDHYPILCYISKK